jgi:hypothetical protein
MMEVKMQEVERFGNDKQFEEMETKLQLLVRLGQLHAHGFDPSERVKLVEIFSTPDGETWRLAHPDHAFRGYLRKD